MKHDTTLPPQAHDLTGQTFGRWTIVGFAGIRAEKTYWLCRCTCGTERAVSAAHLRRGKSTNCGCRRKETMRAMHLAHGYAGTPEYAAWAALIARCTNPDHPGFADYGARGIGVCERWRSNFKAFLEDMGPRPTAAYSIDRINNDADYSPENCRWATKRQQCNNTRRNVFIAYAGKTQTLVQWAEEVGITPNALTRRLRAWPVERALTRPAMPYKTRTQP